MHKMKQLRNEKGFTIIEVMIVLAIAGFIMGIVFIAIPALQRNSRNTARQADASLLAGAMGDCFTNKNGVVASCDTWVEINPFADQTRLKQLTVVPVLYVKPVGAVAGAAVAVPVGVNTTTPALLVGAKCNAATDAAVVATDREYSVLYQVETTSGTTYRCIGS